MDRYDAFLVMPNAVRHLIGRVIEVPVTSNEYVLVLKGSD
jgi:hypothetical protein